MGRGNLGYSFRSSSQCSRNRVLPLQMLGCSSASKPKGYRERGDGDITVCITSVSEPYLLLLQLAEYH